MPVIRISGISKSYAHPVFTSLTLEIFEKEFVVFLGPSGCGKSTLLRLISGIEDVDSGSISLTSGTAASVVFQEPRLLPWRTVVENVMLPLEIQGGEVSEQARRERACSVIQIVGLAEFIDHYPRELSGGMQMRVAIARALVTKPKLLLLDEPFAALDEVSRFRLQEELSRLWREAGLTVVFVTHSLAEAVYLGTRHLVFSRRPARLVVDRAGQLPTQLPTVSRIRTGAAFQAEIEALQSFLTEGAI